MLVYLGLSPSSSGAFQVGVDHEWDALLPAVIAETQPLIVLT